MIQRYDIDANDPWEDVMYPAEQGAWIRYEDVKPMLEELANLRRSFESISEALNSGDGSYRA